VTVVASLPSRLTIASTKTSTIGLRGRIQIVNASTAIALAEALCERGFPITREAITTGVETVTHPGRLEIWEGRPEILFDGAHNPAAARALRDYLNEFVKQPITMIFGAMKDKALPEMAATLFPKLMKLILTGLDNPRAATAEALMSAVPVNFDKARVRLVSSAQDAVQTRQKSGASGWSDLRYRIAVSGWRDPGDVA